MVQDDRLRAFWWQRQGFSGGGLRGKRPGAILTAAGWARSVAGAGPYLTFFSRGGLSRAVVDESVARAEVHELPAARGCTYVLPEADYALGLKLGQPFTDLETKVAMKLGVTAKELEKLQAAIVAALNDGPLDTDGLRTAVGAAARSLGTEGAKKGITTTLPVALGILQSEAEIRRIPVNGRLDQQRYRYALWSPNPLKGFALSGEDCLRELALRYFAWTGAASLAEFQWFSGASGKAARAATEGLGLESVKTSGGHRLMLPGGTEELAAVRVPKKPEYALVSSLDGLSSLRRDVGSLVAAEDLGRVQGKKGLVSDLPDHAIFDRGRLVGLWEFDVETTSIVWISFCKADAGLADAVRATEAFVRDELGDARRASLDSPQSRVGRIAALRASAGAGA